MPITPPREEGSFKQGVVAILVAGIRRGTGFFIDKGLVVTCAHVIDDFAESAPTTKDVRVRLASSGLELPARIVDWRAAKNEDIAVLKCVGHAGDAKVLRLRDIGTEQDIRCDSFGYSQVGNINGLIAQAEVRGVVKTDSGIPLIQVDSNELAPGCSGAPLIDRRTGRALGIVSMIVKQNVKPLEGRFGTTAFAVHATTLASLIPNLLVEPPRLDEDHRKAVEKLQQGAAGELRRSSTVTKLLASKIVEQLDNSGPADCNSDKQPEAVTRVLFESPLNAVLDIVLETYHEVGTGAEGYGASDLNAIVAFGSHLFPAVYDEEQLRDIRSAIESKQPFLALPSTTNTIVEILMAGIAGRRAMFAAPFGKDSLPGGELQIHDPPETGMSEEPFAVEFEAALYEKLAIHKLFRDRPKINVAITGHLKSGKRYYYIFTQVDEARLDRHREQVIERLKRTYPDIVFIKRCRPRDDMKEFQLLYRLQEMFRSNVNGGP